MPMPSLNHRLFDRGGHGVPSAHTDRPQAISRSSPVLLLRPRANFATNSASVSRIRSPDRRSSRILRINDNRLGVAELVIAATPSPPHYPHFVGLLTLCIVCTRGCLQREAGRKRNHPGLECRKLSIGHIRQPSRNCLPQCRSKTASV